MQRSTRSRGQLLERRAHQRRVEVFRAVGVCGDEWQVDRGLGDRRQFDLRLLGRLEQSLQRLWVVAQVDAVVLLERLGEMVHDAPVEVVTTEMGVTGRRPNLDHTVADVEEADIECAAAEVEDEHGLVLASCPARTPARPQSAR